MSKRAMLREKLIELMEISEPQLQEKHDPVSQALIEHVLDGNLSMTVKDDRVAFSATEKGKERARKKSNHE